MSQIEPKRVKRRESSIWAGLLILIVGVSLLAREFGVDFPYWFFSWEMLLIGIGLFIGLKNNFRDFGWLIMVGIGLIFLLDDVWDDFQIGNYIWPAIIIGVGLLIILRPFRTKRNVQEGDAIVPSTPDPLYPQEDILDIAAIFGSIKKIIYSKNFKGGEYL